MESFELWLGPKIPVLPQAFQITSEILVATTEISAAAAAAT